MARGDAHGLGQVVAACGRVLDQIESLWPEPSLDSPGAVDSIRARRRSPPDLSVCAVHPGARLIFVSPIVDLARLDDLAARLQGGCGPAGALGPALAGERQPVTTCRDAAEALLGARAVLLRSGRRRSPPAGPSGASRSEVVVQGPPDGCRENRSANAALLRHRIPERAARWERLQVGLRRRLHGGAAPLAAAARAWGSGRLSPGSAAPRAAP